MEPTPAGTHQPNEPSSEERFDSIGRRILVNTSSLAGSSLWRIFISFVLQVLITRLLGVAAFGQYVSVLAFLNVGQAVSELGLPALLVRDLAQEPTQRRGFYVLALRVQVTGGLATWFGLALLTWLLPISPATQQAIWLGGAMLPLFAVTSASETLFKACERMELVMGVEGAINTLILLLSLAVLWQGGGVLALFAVLVVAQALSAALCGLLVSRQRLLSGPTEAVQVNWRKLWPAARPFYWLSLADVLLHRLDILLLNIVAGDLVTGIYSIAYSVVRVMSKLIQSYWQALYPTLSRLRHRASEQYRLLSALSLRYGLLATLPAVAVGFGLAPEMLHFLYGDDAAASVAVLQVLLWTAPIFLVEMYAVTQLMAIGHPRLSLQATWVHIASIFVLLPLLTRQAGAMGAAAALVIASAAGAVWGVVLLRRLSIPCHVSRLVPVLAATLLAAILATTLPFVWWLRAFVGGSAYLAIVWLTGAISPSDRHILRAALRGRNHRWSG